MLGLLAPTDVRWVEAVEGDLDGLLVDHAHCELKAAQSALSFVARFGGECPNAVAPLVALAHEETDHFHEVERRIRARGQILALPRSDDYVVMLRKASRALKDDAPPLLDRLLVSALVEARSCERFKILAENLGDADLRGFYRDLMASEARHFRLFARLAEEAFGEDATRTRLARLAAAEAQLNASLPLGPSVHG